MTRILVATQNGYQARSIAARYPDKAIVQARPWTALCGLRGETVVVMPPDPGMSPRELEAFKTWLREDAPNKRRDLGTPLIMGELL